MNLRPTNLEGITGQKKTIEAIQTNVKAVQHTGEVFPHMLLSGPAGTGKSLICEALSHELGRPIEIANASNISGFKGILPYLMRVKEHSILFVDEVHRLGPRLIDSLLTIVEQFRLDLGEDGNVSFDLPRFTFIAATTNKGKLPNTFIDRFILKYTLKLYSQEELSEIVQRNADKLDIKLSDAAVKMVVASSRKTPRIANNRLLWIRNYAIANNLSLIERQHVEKCLHIEDVDKNGFTYNDRKYIKELKKHQPAGINTMVAVTNIEKDTVESVIEPFLLTCGVIKKTRKGRMLV